ncbi:MAG TPA: hypothetical protein PLD23_06625 [Armatimonadota bacterium]|nr:hypothetical protein [Armatimonadota bacterium]
MPRYVSSILAGLVGVLVGMATGELVARATPMVTHHGYSDLNRYVGALCGAACCLGLTLLGPRPVRDVLLVPVVAKVSAALVGCYSYARLGDLRTFFSSVLPGATVGQGLHWLIVEDIPLGLLTLAGTYPVALWIRRRAAEAEAEAGAARAARAARNEDGTWNVG